MTQDVRDGILPLRIAQKLPMMIVASAVATAVVIGLAGYLKAASELEELSERKLTALVESRAAALSDYLDSIRQDLAFQAANPRILAAVRDFDAAWDELGGNQTATLQRLYIDDNPHPTGRKEKLDRASDTSTYSEVHAEYHPWIRTFLEERGYYDIFLFDPDGNLVYTVFKELDYATNLNSGEWKDTDLGNAFRAARNKPVAGSQNFFDFRPYAPSHDAPAAFISTPIMNQQGRFEGVLVFQMPIGRMDHIMQNAAGMGETGETYLVGGDFLMRSDSRFSKESTILSRKVETEPVKEALAGASGVMTAPDYHDVEVVSAYRPLEFGGVRWAILAEAEEAEVMAGVRDLAVQILIFSLVIAAGVAAGGVFVARSIVRPMANMTEAMGTLADGNLEVAIPSTDRGDEIGLMARAVQVFKDNAVERQRLESEQRQAAAEAEARAKKVGELCADFDKAVSASLEAVTSATTELQSTAQSMTATAEETARQATAVAAASEQATNNVQTVSAATEELSSSIGEIGRQVSNSSQITKRAVEEAGRTNDSVQGLAQAAQKIGDVVNLITEIAEQTNLLALNATIEAARAGEAGKGFAVVASEVKSLANQTAKATDEIASQISAMQGVTVDVVKAIKGIGETIAEVNDIATSIASAVEEQGAATQEISRNVEQAASGTREVSGNISGVSQAASETGSGAGQVLSASEDLSRQSDAVRQEVDAFLGEVRAAS